MVMVWWPFGGGMMTRITQKNEELDAAGDKKASATKDGLIPCVVSELDVDPILLPSLPQLPDLGDTDDEELRIIQIGGLDGQLIALTNYGHVLKFDDLLDESAASRGAWQYVRCFSLTSLALLTERAAA
jgi:SCF-associated factor 1